MKSKEREKELQFELKYCERCGGLWLRPAGGSQIYCAACGRAMAELPSPSKKPRNARMPEGPRWGAGGDEVEGYDQDEEIDLDAAEGVA